MQLLFTHKKKNVLTSLLRKLQEFLLSKFQLFPRFLVNTLASPCNKAAWTSLLRPFWCSNVSCFGIVCDVDCFEYIWWFVPINFAVVLAKLQCLHLASRNVWYLRLVIFLQNCISTMVNTDTLHMWSPKSVMIIDSWNLYCICPLLLSTVIGLLQDKKTLKLVPEDQLHLEGFALNVFARADKQDRAGRADLYV